MPYGTIKVDNITFTDNSVDKTVSLSGLIQNPTFTGNVTVTGTISGDVIRGGTTISGVTVTGTTANFVSGVFTTQVSGTTITGTTVATTTGSFVSLTGTTATFTSGIIASGTAALPSLAILSDPNTGIYSPGADQLAVATNGTGRLFIDATGNVGVGAAASANGVLRLNVSSGNNANLVFSENSTDRYLLGQVTGDNALRVYDLVAASERLRITSGGLVGIGTSSPSNTAGFNQQLQLSGNLPCISIDNTGTGANKYSLGVNGVGALGVWDNTASAFRMYINSTGAVGIGTTSPGAKLDVSGDAIFNGGGTQFPIQFANAFTPNVERADLFFSANATSNNALRVGTIASNGGVTLQGTRQSDSSQKVNLVLNPDGGSVGIGTTSPGSTLHVVGSIQTGSTADTIYTNNIGLISSSANLTLDASSAQVVFKSGGGEAARLDASKRLLVGTSSARANFYNSTNSARFQIEGSGSNDNYALSIVSNYAGGTSGAQVILAKSGGSNVGDNTLVLSGNTIGQINFQGADGTEFVEAASIKAEVDGTPGANDMPGCLVFSTTVDGGSSPTERMRITSAGRFAFGGQGAPYSSSTCDSYNNTSGEFAHAFRQDHVSGFGLGVGVDGTYLAYFYPNKDLSGAPVGSISQNGSATAYNTSSDYRLKENISLLPNAIVRLLELKPSRFNFISHPDRTVDGFIAHEVQAIVPEAINGEKDEVDDDGNPVYQGIDQSKLVPLLTAALQEAIAKIEILEARLTAAGIE